ncbi:hypothetical protein BT93_I0067 [Corymbia citriodora subsp. variegata]|nr:hypothetical protein BT93_I0067 [Corymbia citriodora subsp. variegata]
MFVSMDVTFFELTHFFGAHLQGGKESAYSHNTEHPHSKNPIPTTLVPDFEPYALNNENSDPPILASHPTCEHNRCETSTKNTEFPSYSQVYTRRDKTQEIE